jgi:hypothetical protein
MTASDKPAGAGSGIEKDVPLAPDFIEEIL